VSDNSSPSCSLTSPSTSETGRKVWVSNDRELVLPRFQVNYSFIVLLETVSAEQKLET
jgi:hypothetical protein